MQSIKRHPALADLSRHHHHALALCLKITKAANDAEAEPALVEAIREFWEQGGQEHFREEEEFVLPSYSRYAEIDHPEITAMLLEHVQIRALADIITRIEGEHQADIRQFGSILEKHVRREERVIFPMVEKALPAEELDRLSPYLHEDSPNCRIQPN
jgi:hemerythrin-like domain-containing protein